MLFILTIILGFLIIDILLPKWTFFEKFFLGYGLGMGITTTLMTILEFFDFLNLGFLYAVIVIAIIPLLLKVEKIKLPSLKGVFKKRKFAEWFLIILPLLVIFSVSLVTVTSLLLWPVHAWDAITLYDFRARFLAGGGTFLQLSNMNYHYYFSYPFLTSNSHLMFYLEGWSSAKIVYVLYGLGLYFLFYSFIRKFNLSITWSLILTALLISDPLIFRVSKIAYTNLPYLFYLVAGIFLFYLWLEENDVRTLLVSSLMFAISTHVRFADMFYILNIGFLFLLFLLRKVKIKDTLIFTFPILAFHFAWKYISSFFRTSVSDVVSMSERIALGFKGFTITRAQEVFLFYFEAMTRAYKVYLIVFLIISLAGFVVILKKRKAFLGTIYLFYMFIFSLLWSFSGNYFISFGYENWRRTAYSLQRLSLLIVPLLFLLFADFMSRLKFTRRHG